VIAAFTSGERPGVWAAAGIGVAIAAIVLVSQQGDAGPADDPPFRGARRRWPRGLGLALLSGVAIGFFFLALARTGPAAGLWPLVAARAVSVALFVCLGIAAARSFRIDRRVLAVAVAGGALDMLANAFYIIASRGGPLSIVVTLSSLYPASTVVLARIVLRERLSRAQMVGIACALVAVVLIVSGG
jgi:drug/metabolite transporter (DMT)-like permease